MFKPVTQDAFRNRLIVSWLFNQVPGAHNPFLKTLDLVNLPWHEVPSVPLVNPEPPEDSKPQPAKFSLEDLFKSNYVEWFSGTFNYFYYHGSFTYPQPHNPDCEEKVRWIVVSDPVDQGKALMEMLRDAAGRHLHGTSTPFQGNNRLTQSSKGRSVQYFDIDQSDCGYKHSRMKDSPIDGHSEMLTQKEKVYFFLKGTEHSGLKNAKMVSEAEELKLSALLGELKETGLSM